MPPSSIDRLQAPLRAELLKKLSANFRPVGRVGETSHGQLAFRRAAFLTSGIILTEVNVKDIANHTIEISQEAGTGWGLVGAVGTPNTGTATGGRSWDVIDFAAAVPALTVVASASTPPATGQRTVSVP